jgi:hypothetical protein
MVYHDYDEDEGIDDEAPPEAIGDVSTQRKARVLNCRRKCFGVPFSLLAVLGVVSLGLVISRAGSQSSAESVEEVAPTPPPVAMGEPSPSPTPHPTHEGLTAETDWVQLGNNVDGVHAPGNFGVSVGVSGNGKVLAVGAHKAVGKTAESGHVRVYLYNDQTFQWEAHGSLLAGTKNGDELGYAIDLSRDGQSIAIGAPSADRHTGPDYGHFSVYSWNATIQDWTQKGTDKWGIVSGDRTGQDVTISSDGSVVAIGAPGDNKNGQDSGDVRVFTFEGGFRWLRKGQDLKGEEAGDGFGTSVAISDDGHRVIAGAPYSNDAGEKAGHMRVFQYDWGKGASHKFHKVSHTIVGRDPNDNFGMSVACSADGSIIAGGSPNAPHNDLLGAGSVDIYKFHPDEGKYHKLGHIILGKAAGENFGSSVELSSDGLTLIAGGPNRGTNQGVIRIYQYDATEDDWVQVGQPIQGDGDHDYWGNAVAVSSNGRVIVSGGNNFEGLKEGALHVRAYHGV